jgi:hypothetical protein
VRERERERERGEGQKKYVGRMRRREGKERALPAGTRGEIGMPAAFTLDRQVIAVDSVRKFLFSTTTSHFTEAIVAGVSSHH